MAQPVLRLAQLASTKHSPGKLPVSRATIWRWVANGQFPKPFKLSPGVTVWDAAEVGQFIEQQRQGGAK